MYLDNVIQIRINLFYGTNSICIVTQPNSDSSYLLQFEFAFAVEQDAINNLRIFPQSFSVL